MALRHPERVAATVSQNGNACEEGLNAGWDPIRAYLKEPSEANRKALRAFLSPETTIWQYTHGIPDTTSVSPDGYSLDNYYLARPGADETQLNLFGDYKSNIALYPEFQSCLRKHRPPLLTVWGRNDPFFLPAGAEAFKRDMPTADVRFSIPATSHLRCIAMRSPRRSECLSRVAAEHAQATPESAVAPARSERIIGRRHVASMAAR